MQKTSRHRRKSKLQATNRRTSAMSRQPLRPIQPTASEKAPVAAPSGQDVIHRVIPDASQSALDTIRGTVRVSIRAHVDPSGDVSEVAIDSPGPSRYFARLAQQAAQQWKFSPNRNYKRLDFAF